MPEMCSTIQFSQITHPKWQYRKNWDCPDAPLPPALASSWSPPRCLDFQRGDPLRTLLGSAMPFANRSHRNVLFPIDEQGVQLIIHSLSVPVTQLLLHPPLTDHLRPLIGPDLRLQIPSHDSPVLCGSVAEVHTWLAVPAVPKGEEATV